MIYISIINYDYFTPVFHECHKVQCLKRWIVLNIVYSILNFTENLISSNIGLVLWVVKYIC